MTAKRFNELLVENNVTQEQLYRYCMRILVADPLPEDDLKWFLKKLKEDTK